MKKLKIPKAKGKFSFLKWKSKLYQKLLIQENCKSKNLK